MMGVSYNEFWEMNPKELEPFTKAFSLKQDVIDTNMWVMGRYITLGVASLLSKETKYPTKPFNRTKNTTQQDEIKAKFLYRMEQLNSRFKKD